MRRLVRPPQNFGAVTSMTRWQYCARRYADQPVTVSGWELVPPLPMPPDVSLPHTSMLGAPVPVVAMSPPPLVPNQPEVAVAARDCPPPPVQM
jgi:hypothetical protein